MQTGTASVKQAVEELLLGKSFTVPIDEQIVFNQLDASTNAVWSLLLASGYLKVVGKEELRPHRMGEPRYTLTLTNYEVLLMFRKMVKGWFRIDESDSAYNNFVKALRLDDVDAMNEFKVHKPKREKDLEETVANALAQIAEKKYEAELIADGIAPERIRKYGFAFEGKMCLIG